MAQPFNRKAMVAAPAKLDQKLGEFWVDNPFDFRRQAHNLSAFERSRTFLNLGNGKFLDISYVSGADGDGDGRAVVAADFRNNGQQDIVVRQVGGGPLRLYENGLAAGHYLKVSLRGTRSNRLGIGARLTAVVGGQRLVRELYPLNSFRSQMPSLVHFGLGDAERVEQLTIRWPSGEVQELANLPADRQIIVEEGQPADTAVETVIPGETIRP